MAQKSKAASLTGELLAPKGAAEPAAQSQQPGNGAAVSEPPRTGEAVANGGRVEFPLQLDPADHFELRMASARSGRSCQELILEALARYLADIEADSGDAESPQTGEPE